MDPSQISELELHDGVLVSIDMTWAQRRCRLLVHPVSLVRRTDCLVFEGVTRLLVPNEMPWGPSISINGVTFVDGKVAIEMQSGDTIEIIAKSVEYHAL
jgi:hypothetical protein